MQTLLSEVENGCLKPLLAWFDFVELLVLDLEEIISKTKMKSSWYGLKWETTPIYKMPLFIKIQTLNVTVLHEKIIKHIRLAIQFDRCYQGLNKIWF